MTEVRMPGMPSRLAFVDALKALAFQLIVLHHLAFYGPMSDHAYLLAPDLIRWLSQDARMAVQAFLVIGGFLAVRSLAPDGVMLATHPLDLVQKRYLKLVLPYLTAMLIGVACAAIAREWMVHDSIPGRPTLPQVVAHALLLQSILGYEGLSAGVWYVAIDFQLFALLVGVLWLARTIARGTTIPTVSVLLVVTLALASLYYFNRDGAWDVWGVYFFAAYALGIVTYWATDHKKTLGWLLPMVGLVAIALLLDYRPRLVVALLVALAIGLARIYGWLENWPRSRLIAYLGQISYSVFLVHFPICLLINGLFARFAASDPWVNLAGMCIAWLASIAAGALFFRYVESPAQRGFWRTQAPPGLRPMH
ncbi:MAG TPA: acyltransferase [Accumulibacter sp.]|uniref:acyltransferase family protein n=1 Tax=Accumulibacter sp. TaxID=2053492 RepID=UPI002D18EE21|nr:acyltransferase [Accumulibacter sp.]HMW55089.1 acyltransferase [Accumulibacter sp.]